MGLTKDVSPCARGFKKNFSFLPGSGNHYAFEPQLEYDEFRAPFMKTSPFWMEGERFLDFKKDLPKDFYSTRSFTDRLLHYFETRSDSKNSGW